MITKKETEMPIHFSFFFIGTILDQWMLLAKYVQPAKYKDAASPK